MNAPGVPLLPPSGELGRPALPRSVIAWQWMAAAGLLIGVVLPLLLGLALALRQGLDVSAWAALIDEVQTASAWRLSLFSAVASSALALAGALLLGSGLFGRPAWSRLVPGLGAMLAVPHAAAAIGLLWLFMPAGWLARAAAGFSGWRSPPDWRMVNDPLALSLTLALAVKELPFLLWMLAAFWARPEVRQGLHRQIALGRSLGHGRARLWRRMLWPQCLSALRWPLLAVLAYGLTVVDMALILGPGSPPTLAVLAWNWLLDADTARNAQGAAAALALGATLLGLVLIGAALRGPLRRGWTRLACAGPSATAPGVPRTVRSSRSPQPDLSPADAPAWPARLARGGALSLIALYGLLLLVLVVASFSGVWTFPSLLPQAWSSGAWQQAWVSGHTLFDTTALAVFAAALALLCALAWLEAAPPAWDRWAMAVAAVPVLVPTLLLLVGLYRLCLNLRLDGSWLALVWVHALMALPYVMVALLPAWRGLDPRYGQVALSLGRGRARVAWQLRWPMLAAPLAAAGAVGFAVSVAQYLPTLFIGAGRHSTVATEAVTLAAGGQRHTAAAQALLQALLPLLGFVLASRVGRRWEAER